MLVRAKIELLKAADYHINTASVVEWITAVLHMPRLLDFVKTQDDSKFAMSDTLAECMNIAQPLYKQSVYVLTPRSELSVAIVATALHKLYSFPIRDVIRVCDTVVLVSYTTVLAFGIHKSMAASASDGIADATSLDMNGASIGLSLELERNALKFAKTPDVAPVSVRNGN